MTSKNIEKFEIAPPQQVEVGTEILDPNLPSNLDFDDKEKTGIEMVEIKPKHCKVDQQLGRIDLQNLDIRSYMVKGKVVFNLEPLHPISSLLPTNTKTYAVKCFNDEYSPGLKRIWETLIGYTNREMYVNQGYIYLLSRQKQGLIVIAYWKLVNLFKIFLDYEDSKLRLVLKQEGSEHLQMKDYELGEIRQLLQKLGQQINSIGLSLIG